MKSGLIVPSQKNSLNRSCNFANNEIVNNSRMNCCKIMMHLIFKPLPGCLAWTLWHRKAMTGKWIIQVHVQRGISFGLRRLGWNLCYQFHPQGFIKMSDRTGSVHDVCWRLRNQSTAIDERFVCSYRLVIDWPIPIDTSELILYWLIDWICDLRFPSIGHPG